MGAFSGRLVRSSLAALLMFAFGGGGRSAQAQDERADLKLEMTGLSGARIVQFKITNVSVWWSDETKLRIETLAPSAGNVVNLDVENLDPGQVVTFAYTLTADCDGTTVKAELSPGKNYAGVPENKLDNNRFQGQVCKPKLPAPAQPSDPVGLAPNNQNVTRRSTGASEAIKGAAIPEYARPGTHTLTLNPGDAMGINVVTLRGGESLVVSPRSTAVGWAQNEYVGSFLINDRSVTQVAQAAVTFDLGALDALPQKLVSQAVLSFEEQPFRWTNSEGGDEFKPGCVTTVGTASVNWAAGWVNALIPNEYYDGVAPNARELVVTQHVMKQLAFADDPTLRFGFVLRGSEEDPQGEDDASCMSTVSNIRLSVTYVVPG